MMMIKKCFVLCFSQRVRGDDVKVEILIKILGNPQLRTIDYLTMNFKLKDVCFFYCGKD